MPKCKNYSASVPRFYKFQTFDHVMFGYVQGLRKALPSMKIQEALLIFLNTFGLTEDDYCLDNARATYYRILNSIIEIKDDPNIDRDMII